MYIRPHYLSGAEIYHFHIDVYMYVAIDVTKADTSGIRFFYGSLITKQHIL